MKREAGAVVGFTRSGYAFGMMGQSLYRQLETRFAAAVGQVAGAAAGATDPLLRISGDPKFGDYQCNAAMGLAKVLGAKPREVAERIRAAAEPLLADLAEPLEIAGPGFINVRLRVEALERQLENIPAPEGEPGGAGGGAGAAEPGGGAAAAGDPSKTRDPARLRPACRARFPVSDRVGIAVVEHPRRVVVEYSQPNVAKQMHVGHLRTTIIGDVFARVLILVGHEVILQNHIGDWGTQFGILIRWYREHTLPTGETHPDLLEAIEADYRAASERFENDDAFATEARRAVAELQRGDPEARRVWEQICALSYAAFTEIYDRLGVLLRVEDVRGESFYNDRLAGVIEELRQAGRAQPAAPAEGTGAGKPAPTRLEIREDQGAVVAYLYDAAGQPLFKNADGEILGMIVQKSDGAYLYATTDLAAIRFRLRELRFSSGVGAERIIYVTDDRQKLHFQQFIACARAAGWVGDEHEIDHVTYGAVLGADRKPLRTRAGGTIKLRELLDEAEERAYRLLLERGGTDEAPASPEAKVECGTPEDAIGPGAGPPRTSEADRREVARRVGIAAVKYADLRNDRSTPYVFDWDKMISFQGNTAPYMMYAYARVRSIYRKAAAQSGMPDVYGPGARLIIREPTERALGLRLARFPEVIEDLAANLLPHTLCTYLYDLAGDFMRFYESCPVLAAPDEATRLSRLRLCDLTARTLKLGLSLIGIEVLERM